MEKEYCYFCNKDVEPVVSIQKNPYIVHKKTVYVEEKVLSCPLCNSEIISSNLDDTLYSAYNEYLKLNDLSYEELKKIRLSYGLSQELFAQALNWSKKTIWRYENAETLPQNEYLAVYKRIKNNKDEFIKIVQSNKDKMEEKTYYHILNIIGVELDEKTMNTFLYVLKNNYLTKTQIMKNLFALDFESYKENKKTITTLEYAHGTYGPIIDKKDYCLDYLIKQNYLKLVSDENDIIKFMPNKECNLSLFTNDEIKIMDKVLKTLKNKDAKELTKWSHKFKGWVETDNGKIIKYDYAKDFDLNKNWN